MSNCFLVKYLSRITLHDRIRSYTKRIRNLTARNECVTLYRWRRIVSCSFGTKCVGEFNCTAEQHCVNTQPCIMRLLLRTSRSYNVNNCVIRVIALHCRTDRRIRCFNKLWPVLAKPTLAILIWPTLAKPTLANKFWPTLANLNWPTLAKIWWPTLAKPTLAKIGVLVFWRNHKEQYFFHQKIKMKKKQRRTNKETKIAAEQTLWSVFFGEHTVQWD